MAISVAGAPVSFGIFELTPESADVYLPGPEAVLESLQRAGFVGVDLGPVGFLGRGTELRDRLRRFGLPLAGGWIDLPFSDDDAFRAALPKLDETLDVFDEAEGAIDGAPRALPTLADAGDAIRKAHPGGDPRFFLDDERWGILARNVATAAGRVRARGFEPTFHHHACTYVETPAEIDRFVAETDVGLTLDTGHLLLGGGSPELAWERWGDRINHIHIKDVDLAILRQIQARNGGMLDVWSGGTFVPLGRGDLNISAILDSIVARDYAGWIVVEQDVMPAADGDPAATAADQAINRDALRKWIP
jgi:inosose dehydratase